MTEQLADFIQTASQGVMLLMLGVVALLLLAVILFLFRWIINLLIGFLP
jgi:hypothetical protein